jgi:hypothetical protein
MFMGCFLVGMGKQYRIRRHAIPFTTALMHQMKMNAYEAAMQHQSSHVGRTKTKH